MCITANGYINYLHICRYYLGFNVPNVCPEVIFNPAASRETYLYVLTLYKLIHQISQ